MNSETCLLAAAEHNILRYLFNNAHSNNTLHLSAFLSTCRESKILSEAELKILSDYIFFAGTSEGQTDDENLPDAVMKVLDKARQPLLHLLKLPPD